MTLSLILGIDEQKMAAHTQHDQTKTIQFILHEESCRMARPIRCNNLSNTKNEFHCNRNYHFGIQEGKEIYLSVNFIILIWAR